MTPASRAKATSAKKEAKSVTGGVPPAPRENKAALITKHVRSTILSLRTSSIPRHFSYCGAPARCAERAEVSDVLCSPLAYQQWLATRRSPALLRVRAALPLLPGPRSLRRRPPLGERQDEASTQSTRNDDASALPVSLVGRESPNATALFLAAQLALASTAPSASTTRTRTTAAKVCTARRRTA